MIKNLLNNRLSLYFLLLIFVLSSSAFGQVSNFTPKSIVAGNGSILTITGSGFGPTRPIGAYVAFPGSKLIKVLEADYVNWSDTEIKVIVPEGAGSGSPTLYINAYTSFTLGYLTVASLVYPDAFTPTHISAGTGSLLTIWGSGFGPNKTANNYVEFLGGDAHQSKVRPEADDYVSWSDSKIEVKVPSGAGDGPLYVNMDNGTVRTIHPWLIIDYNIHKENGQDTKLANMNGAGGYTFHLHTNLNSNNKAKAAFLSAFETWKCATNVNWSIGEPTNSRTGDNVIRILDDDEMDAGAVAQTTVSYINYGSTWYVNNIDITFSKLAHYFKFTPSEPGLYDFQTVALHSLGKALNLEVVINNNDVMYWGRKVNGSEKRALSTNDLNAGNYMVNFSKVSSGYQLPMIPLSPGRCNPAYSYINSFSPNSARGGEVVTITGTNFTNATAVSFGGVAATSFSVVSPTTITAVVAHGSDSGIVRVDGPGGAATALGFTFINKLPQVLSYNSFITKTFGDNDFDPGVTADTGLPIVYTSSNSTVATIINNIVHIVGAGSATITATQAGDATYSLTSVNLNLIVNKASQYITLSPILGKLTTDPDFSLDATASSGLVVSYTSSNPSVATINGSQVHIIKAGTTTITAIQNGDTNYAPAQNVAINLMISNLPQTLTFPEITGKKVDDVDFDPGASVNTGLSITYSSSNTAVATIVNNKIHIVGAGSTIITALQAGNITYAATSKTNILFVTKLSQTITFPLIATKTFNDADFDPVATSSSGMPITYSSSNTSVATIVAGKVHIVAAGTASITATQLGNSTYESVSVSANLTVNKFQQTITFSEITLKNHNDADFDLNAFASSGLPVSYSSSNTSVATIIAGKVHLVAAGAAVITASQAGNTNINSATATQNLDVIYNIPVSNFTVKSTDETCKASNNGAINITATQILSYTATVTKNGATNTYPFNSVLALNNLEAGIYTVCLTVAGQPNYKQCFDLTIKEPKDLAIYSRIKNEGNTVVLKLEGSDLYRIELNGQVFTTSNQEISLPLIKGNNLVKVSSDKSCQGIIERTFLTTNNISLYPNPIKNILNITTGSMESNTVKVDIHALDGRLVYSNQHKAEYGRVGIDLSKLNKGLYVLTLTAGNAKTVHKVIKD